MSSNVVILIGRILLAIIFIMSGAMKLMGPGTADNAMSMAGMVASKGLPAPVVLTYLAGLLELFGGLAVLLGFYTRLGAWALALFSVVAAVLFHMGATGDPMMDAINPVMFLKNLAMAGGFLILAASGPGSISIDARRA